MASAPYFSGRFAIPITRSDFNHDGILDLAVVNEGSNSVTILRGKADGTFESQSIYGVGVGPTGIATGDFNGDGAPDMAVVNLGTSTVSVFLSSGATGGRVNAEFGQEGLPAAAPGVESRSALPPRRVGILRPLPVATPDKPDANRD
jgi:hypothetical protein